MSSSRSPDPAGTAKANPSRREQILAVAATQFAERGFHGVSVYDLGAALGISGAALYKHFASKEAILGEMLVGISERLLTEGRTRADDAATAGADAVLTALIGWHVEFALANPALITVQFRDLASLADSDRRSVRHLQGRYVELWVHAICTAVGCDEKRARSAAHATFGLINSTPHSARLRRTEMAGLLQQMTLGALRAVARSDNAQATGGSP